MRRLIRGQAKPFLLLACVALSGVTALLLSPSRGQTAPVPGCETVPKLKPNSSPEVRAQVAKFINDNGRHDFENPPELKAPPTSEANRLDLIVDYTKKDVKVLGCPVHLRTYNNKVIGPTIRAKPGDTIYVRLINKLPPATYIAPPQKPAPPDHTHFSFSITNLHTHGLHVAPQGPVDLPGGKAKYESDNVLLELGPGDEQEYRFVLPADHPAGTFWYHAHVHGSTAVQLSSGMAGALIIDGGTRENGDLDTVPAIRQVKDREKIMLLQQLAYDTSGTVEKFEDLNKNFRPTTINGQLVPLIRMQPGEVQRWRLIHGGVGDNIAFAVDGHTIHEVAADGITLGRSVPWAEAPTSNASNEHTLFLAPGYRSDVMIRARKPEAGQRYFVRALDLSPPQSIQAQERAVALAAELELRPTQATPPPIDPSNFEPGQILAELFIEGDEITDQKLPTSSDLAGLVPRELSDITQAEIDETLKNDPNASQSLGLNMKGKNICNAANGLCTPCPPGTGPLCLDAYRVNDRQFSSATGAVRQLKLSTGGKPTVAEWTITTDGTFHPFHIHVNPFQVDRGEPDDNGNIVKRKTWKDTILVQGNSFPPLRMRYLRFTGTFVLHCHILQHEDQGMMQLVQIDK